MATHKDFDPNGIGQEDVGIFGLPFSPTEAQVVLIPAPWGVTVSYSGGTQEGPRAIYEASSQIDYDHPSYGADAWKLGVAMLPLQEWDDAYQEGLALRKRASAYIEELGKGKTSGMEDTRDAINAGCESFHARIEQTAIDLLNENKLVGLIGGDHSTPLGLMRALAKKHGSFGILQIDAHCDLRDAYEGFTYSHASIMWNALKMEEVARLTQVGIRDYAPSERAIIESSNGRIQTFFDTEMKRREFGGESWTSIVDSIVKTLPEQVYVSFDIDGLDPALCPHTGTPVPGGLQFQEAVYLIRAVAESGKQIIGFDVNEVSPGEPSFAKATEGTWDANVGMRVLWNLTLWTAKSQGLKPLAF